LCWRRPAANYCALSGRHGIEWNDDWRNGKHLEGSGRGLIQALPRHLPGGINENYEEPQSG
jgi:hypothetical protein